jgi:hypothetical protein
MGGLGAEAVMADDLVVDWAISTSARRDRVNSQLHATATLPDQPGKPRSVDALRPFLARIEAHALALAGVQFDAAQAPPTMLRVVSAA